MLTLSRLSKQLATEIIGCFVYVFVLLTSLKKPYLKKILPLSNGLTVCLIVSMIPYIHMNPVYSIVMYLKNTLSMPQLIAFVAAQIFGGICAYIVA